MPSQLHQFQTLLKEANIDAWIVPSADPHQSEYVAEHWQARAWLSGFSGSAGTLVVRPDWAGLWTDARYHLRAEAELAGSGIELFRLELQDVPSYLAWLAQELPTKATVGFDASVLSVADVEQLARRLEAKSVQIYTQRNLVQELWHERPPMPKSSNFLITSAFIPNSRPIFLQTNSSGYAAKPVHYKQFAHSSHPIRSSFAAKR